MKAKVIEQDTYETTVIMIKCPSCGKDSTFEYPNDEGYYKTKREEKCPHCETNIEFTYGIKQ